MSMFIGLVGGYLLLAVALVAGALWIAKKKGWNKWLWGGGAAVVAVAPIVALIVWSHTPRVNVVDEPERVKLPPVWTDRVTHEPVKLFFGNRHFEVEQEYIVRTPFKGMYFNLVIGWPTMKSPIESNVEAKAKGEKPGTLADVLRIRLKPAPPRKYDESYDLIFYREPWSISTKRDRIVDLTEFGLHKFTFPSTEYYWSMDEGVRTPYQNRPYTFQCSFDEGVSEVGQQCHAEFQLDKDVGIRLSFSKIYLKDWKEIYYKTIDFIHSIERDGP